MGLGGIAMPDQEPQWQHIGTLPTIAHTIDSMLVSAQRQLATLRRAQVGQGPLDDAIIHQIISDFTAQQDDLRWYKGQLKHWQALYLTYGQRREVERSLIQLARLRDTNEAILQLAHEIQSATLDVILPLDDDHPHTDDERGEILPPMMEAPSWLLEDI
jgi:hypothetical protein